MVQPLYGMGGLLTSPTNTVTTFHNPTTNITSVLNADGTVVGAYPGTHTQNSIAAATPPAPAENTSGSSATDAAKLEALKAMVDAGLTKADIEGLYNTTTTWAPQISDTYGVNKDTFLKAAQNYNTWTNQDLTPPEIVTATAAPGSGLLGLTPDLKELEGLPEETLKQLQIFNEAGMTKEDVRVAGIQWDNLEDVTNAVYQDGYSNKSDKDILLDFTRVAGTYYNQSPDVFWKWANENPQAASLFFARVADTNIDIPVDINNDGQLNNDDWRQAQSYANGYGLLASGNDEHTVTDYSGDKYKDVTYEWGLGDARKIGTGQTPNDGGVIGDIINFSLPGFDAGDILDIPGVDVAAGLLSPVTGGTSLAVYEALKLAEGDPITANTVMSLMPILGSSGLFTTPGGDLDLSALGDLGGSFYDTDFEQAQRNEGNTQTPEEIGEGQDDMLDSMLSDFDRWIRNQGWTAEEWEWEPPTTGGGGDGDPSQDGGGASGGGGGDSTGGVWSSSNPPPADVQVDPNHAPREDETWRHTNPDGTVVAGNEVGEVWEVGEADPGTGDDTDLGWILDGIIGAGVGGIWGDILGDIFGDGTDNSGNGGTGTGTGGTEGTGDGSGSGDGSGNGTGTGTGGNGTGTGTGTGGSGTGGGNTGGGGTGGGGTGGGGTGGGGTGGGGTGDGTGDGTNGTDGTDGTDGIDGRDGADGRPGMNAMGNSRVWEDFYWKINTLMPLAQKMGVSQDEFLAKLVESMK